MESNNGGLVELVQVEPVAHGARQSSQVVRERVAGRSRIKRISRGEPQGSGEQTCARSEGRVPERQPQALGKRECVRGLGGDELPGIDALDADYAANETKYSQHAQRPGH